MLGGLPRPSCPVPSRSPSRRSLGRFMAAPRAPAGGRCRKARRLCPAGVSRGLGALGGQARFAAAAAAAPAVSGRAVPAGRDGPGRADPAHPPRVGRGCGRRSGAGGVSGAGGARAGAWRPLPLFVWRRRPSAQRPRRAGPGAPSAARPCHPPRARAVSPARVRLSLSFPPRSRRVPPPGAGPGPRGDNGRSRGGPGHSGGSCPRWRQRGAGPGHGPEPGKGFPLFPAGDNPSAPGQGSAASGQLHIRCLCSLPGVDKAVAVLCLSLFPSFALLPCLVAAGPLFPSRDSFQWDR